MSLPQTEIDAWVDAYIAAQSSGTPVDADHPQWWAVDRFMEIEQPAEAEDAWVAIQGVLARKPSDAVLGSLAAGPLEDMIQYWGPSFIDRIEDAAHRDGAFRALLGGVWESSTPDVWIRVRRAASGPTTEGS